MRLMWPWVPMQTLCAALEVSTRAAENRAARMQLGHKPVLPPWTSGGRFVQGRRVCRVWSECERALIRRLWLFAPVGEIADRVGCSCSAVRNQARLMGLPARARLWTTHEERLLAREYGPRSAIELGVRLGRGEGAIRRRVSLLRQRGAMAPLVVAVGMASEARAQGP